MNTSSLKFLRRWRWLLTFFKTKSFTSSANAIVSGTDDTPSIKVTWNCKVNLNNRVITAFNVKLDKGNKILPPKYFSERFVIIENALSLINKPWDSTVNSVKNSKFTTRKLIGSKVSIKLQDSRNCYFLVNQYCVVNVDR